MGIYYRYGALLDRVTEPGVKDACQNKTKEYSSIQNITYLRCLSEMPPLKVHFLQPGVEEFKEIQIRPETKQVLDKIVHLFECFRFCIWICNSIFLCV